MTMIQYYLQWLCGGVTTVGVIFFMRYIYKVREQKKYFDLLPGPPGVPIFGMFFKIMLLRQPDKLWDFLQDLTNKYYPFYKIWNIHLGAVFIVGPDDIEKVLSLSKHNEKGLTYISMQPWLGKGLLTNFGSNWHKRRKILTNAFHFNILQEFMDVFAEQCKLLVEKLEKECNQPSTSILPYITEFTLHSICETAMGTRMDAKEKKQEEYKLALYKVGQLVIQSVLSPWLYIETVYYMSPTYYMQKKLAAILHEFSMNVIRNRKVNFKEVDAIMNNQSNTRISKKRLAMLDLLLTTQNSGADITDVEIREEVDTFIFEGHDTTTIAICFALLQIANNVDIQDRIMEELRQVLGESDVYPTYQQLQDMQYLERVIKETLRMYPSVPMISRLTGEDIVTTSGQIIPAAANVFIRIYDLHHRPDIYPDPYKFDPDRFLPEECKNRHPFAYLPFSAGPRNCIGQKFAMIELKSVISAILRKYVLKAVDKPSDMRFVTDMMLRTQNDIRIKLESRLTI